MIDLAIVGGGPVGLVAALYARRAGLSTVVLEPRDAPMDKACGEGLMPEAVRRLAQLGVEPPGRDFVGIRYIARRHSVAARFDAGVGRGVRRTALHAALDSAAQSAGASIVRERVSEIAATPTEVRAGSVTARYLIAADGLHSTVRSAAGLAVSARGLERYGVRQHFAVRPWSDHVEVYWLERAEVYVTPVADDEVGVAVLGPRPINFGAVVESVPALAARLSSAEPTSTRRGAGPFLQTAKAPSRGRVLLVGDAAGYVDALTGEGLRIGFAQAAAAIDAVAAGDITGYDQRWREITRRYRRLTRSLVWVAGRPALRSRIVPTARTFPALFGRGVNAIGA